MDIAKTSMSLSLPSIFHKVSLFYEAMPVSPLCLVVLAAVVEAPGRRPTDHLKDYFPAMNKPDLSVYLKRLETAGLVVRVPNPDDKRSFLYFATEAGQKVVGEAQGVFQGVALGLASRAAPEAS